MRILTAMAHYHKGCARLADFIYVEKSGRKKVDNFPSLLQGSLECERKKNKRECRNAAGDWKTALAFDEVLYDPFKNHPGFVDHRYGRMHLASPRDPGQETPLHRWSEDRPPCTRSGRPTTFMLSSSTDSMGQDMEDIRDYLSRMGIFYIEAVGRHLLQLTAQVREAWKELDKPRVVMTSG